MSDSFVTLSASGAGSEFPSVMPSRSGAIHLTDPALFVVEAEACGDSASAVMDASPKSHRTAFLLLSMRMFGYACSVSDVRKHDFIEFTPTPFRSPCNTLCE